MAKIRIAIFRRARKVVPRQRQVWLSGLYSSGSFKFQVSSLARKVIAELSIGRERSQPGMKKVSISRNTVGGARQRAQSRVAAMYGTNNHCASGAEIDSQSA
jgi:hypothetical protein